MEEVFELELGTTEERTTCRLLEPSASENAELADLDVSFGKEKEGGIGIGVKLS